MDLWGTNCPDKHINISLDYPFFNYTLDDENCTLLYDCDHLSYPSPLNLSSSARFECPIDGVARDSYFMLSPKWANVSALGCSISIMVPILKEAMNIFIMEALDPGDVIVEGFDVKWELEEEGSCEDCRNSGGRCGYNLSMTEFKCLCHNQTHNGICGIDPLLAPTPDSEQGM